MMMRTMAMAMMKMVDMAIIRAVARCPWPESSAGIKERKINGFVVHSSKPQHPPGHPVIAMLPWIILDPRTWPSKHVLAARSGPLISSPHTANWAYVYYTWKIRNARQEVIPRVLTLSVTTLRS